MLWLFARRERRETRVMCGAAHGTPPTSRQATVGCSVYVRQTPSCAQPVSCMRRALWATYKSSVYKRYTLDRHWQDQNTPARSKTDQTEAH